MSSEREEMHPWKQEQNAIKMHTNFKQQKRALKKIKIAEIQKG